MKQLEVSILGQVYMLGCPEGGEALPVGVPHAAEVQRWLRAEADEEARRRGVRPRASHRDGAIEVLDAGHGCPLELDRREALPALLPVRASLDDIDADRIVRLIVLANDAVKRSVGEEPAIDVAKEVLSADRRADRVDFHLDLAALRAEDDVGQRLRDEWRRPRDRGGGRRESEQDQTVATLRKHLTSAEELRAT